MNWSREGQLQLTGGSFCMRCASMVVGPRAPSCESLFACAGRWIMQACKWTNGRDKRFTSISLSTGSERVTDHRDPSYLAPCMICYRHPLTPADLSTYGEHVSFIIEQSFIRPDEPHNLDAVLIDRYELRAYKCATVALTLHTPASLMRCN